MKIKNSIVAVIVIAAGFTSCKKDNTTIPPTAPEVIKNERLILVSADANDTYTFSFNPDKSVKKVEWGSGSQKSFSYSNNLVTAITTINGKKIGEDVYELKNGITQKQTATYLDGNGNINAQTVATYIYNTGGLLEKAAYITNGANGGYVQYTYDNNKDLKEYSYYNGAGALQAKAVYEYATLTEDKSATFGRYNTSGDNNLFPRLSKHIYTKITQSYPLTNTIETYTYSHTLDAKGYVVKQVLKDKNGTTLNEINNTWEQ